MIKIVFFLKKKNPLFTMCDCVDFYDALAENYHLLFKNGFDAAQQWMGGKIEAIIRRHFATDVKTISILDCACGIGTQALPLAASGFSVFASDLSAGAVKRCKIEAKKRNLNLKVECDDMR